MTEKVSDFGVVKTPDTNEGEQSFDKDSKLSECFNKSEIGMMMHHLYRVVDSYPKETVQDIAYREEAQALIDKLKKIYEVI
jgi:hypothetical protein